MLLNQNQNHQMQMNFLFKYNPAQTFSDLSRNCIMEECHWDIHRIVRQLLIPFSVSFRVHLWLRKALSPCTR